jgi:hypothetical protein
MKRVRKIQFIIVLCTAIGAACGFYLFFAYSSGFTFDGKNTHIDSPALLNYSPEGWNVKPPVLQFAGDNKKNTVPYAEILRIRF